MIDNDDEDHPPSFAPGSSGLKSLFAMDEAAKKDGNDTFQWSKKKTAKPKAQKAAAAAAAATPAADATPAAQLHRLGVKLFLTTSGQPQDYGVAMLAVMAKGDAPAVVMCYDRAKQTLLSATLGAEGPNGAARFAVTTDEHGQFLANVTDDAGQSWAIYFRNAEDASAFGDVVALCKFQAARKQHREERLARYDVLLGTGPPLVTGDAAGVRLKASTIDVGEYGAVPRIVLTFDETVDPADVRRVQLGEGKIMQGFEEGLLGMCRGGRRWVFFSAPELQRIRNGPNLPHPAVSPGDIIGVVFDLVKAKREKPQSAEPAALEPVVVQAAPPQPPLLPRPVAADVPVPPPAAVPAAPAPVPVPVPVSPLPVAPVALPTAPVGLPQFLDPTAAFGLPGVTSPLGAFGAGLGFPTPGLLPGMLPPTAAAPAVDTKSLILQAMMQQPNADPALLALLQQPEEPAPKAGASGLGGVLNTTSQEALEKILGKINRMNEKLDKLDLASQLAVNNTLLIQSFRQIARDMMSSAPGGGIGIGSTRDSGGDPRREQELRQRLLDVQTELAVAQKLAETKAQELVACQATLDQEKESTEHRINQLIEKSQAEKTDLKLRQKEKLRQVAEAEYQRGLTDGQIQEHKEDSDGNRWRIELEDLREQLEAARSAAKFEREEKEREIRALQGLVARHEEAREQFKNQERRLVETQATKDKEVVGQEILAKKLRKVMNSVYFGMEATLQAKEAEGPLQLSTVGIMQLLIRVIKAQTKKALEEEEEEEEEQEGESTQPPPPPPPPLPPRRDDEEWDE
eukprot:TRINITY_DN1125_c1_g1_i1.p1 TRINITY_DN1125_c1_g1~~TRINITY_DN1125_c1_g1_i1.p1  ORF type:complete len:798 (-),score=210.37 TRINITY_DN1125_c1_g1_i1:54-2447(-)